MKRTVPGAAALAILLAATVGARTVPASSSEFLEADAEWRAWRLQRLTSEAGWLTLVGLHWLEPGDNALGSAPGSALLLPAGKAPAKAGVLRLESGEVTLLPEPGSGLTIAGVAVVAPRALVSVDSAPTQVEPEPTVVELGPLRFHLLSSGGRFGLRVRDREAELRRDFPGLDYFAPDPAWRVEARFEANPPGTTVPVANPFGRTDPMPSPGKLTFTLGGRDFTITALDDTFDGRLFLVVGDETNGRETYGGGRFLYADAPRDGRTIVDFNRAYNPPCAFTPWTICPLPPRENRLSIRVEAGEKKSAAAHP